MAGPGMRGDFTSPFRHSSSDTSSDSQVFGQPLPRESTGNPIVKGALQAPGALYTKASLSAAKQTGARGRGDTAAQVYAATGEQWLSYVRTVLAPQFPQGMPSEVMRELKTLASSLEHFAKGEMSELGDILVQRLKSVELALGGNTEAANAVQLVGLREIGLTDLRELDQAQQHLRGELRMEEQQRRLR